MKLLADMHISPDTVAFLATRGHDVIRVPDVMPPTSMDNSVIVHAAQSGRAVLTQDLDFSALVALSGAQAPSIITLRLISSRVEHVNEVLGRVLPQIEDDVRHGALVSVDDHAVRCRLLPLSYAS